MSGLVGDPVDLHDCGPETGDLRAEVLAGLAKPQKELPCKLFYDQRGSQLFDQICEAEDYYPTRTELTIMEEHAPDMAGLLGEECMLIEYGSGSSMKTRLLLDETKNLAAYVPIDISKEHLIESAAAIAKDYPEVPVLPVCADYTQAFTLPKPPKPEHTRSVYFPGSTIGNFHPGEARAFLERIGRVCESGGHLLIGVDLQKDRQTLERAYDDSEGVTATFNLNVLHRLNTEMHGTFDLDGFRHKAFYNEEAGRVEMHLESLRDQKAAVEGRTIEFVSGETIHTECSYKYTLEGFGNLAGHAGFTVERIWTDNRDLFSVQLLQAA